MHCNLVYTHWPKCVAAIAGCLLLAHLLELHSTFSGTYERQLEGEEPSVAVQLEEQPSEPIPTLEDIAFDGSWKEVDRVEFNRMYHDKLRACKVGSDGCARNEGKLVLLAIGTFKSVLDGANQGEAIWSDSFMDSVHALGYSMLIPDNEEELYTMWREYHDQVELIVWNRVRDCQNLSADNTCVQSDPDIPLAPPNATHLNIPLWCVAQVTILCFASTARFGTEFNDTFVSHPHRKIFNLHFWNSPDHPYGSPFTLSPEDYSTWTPPAHGRDNYYLGYSLERTCTKVPYVAHPSRPRQAYVYAKYLRFFDEKNYILRNTTEDDSSEAFAKSNFFQDLSANANMTFVAKMHHNEGSSLDGPPRGIVELSNSMHNRTAFQYAVSNSRVLVGVGNPALSPTPWEALCLGVPFVNAILGWDGADPDDRSRWSAQQEGVLFLGVGEPFVYNVKIGDRLGLEAAIRKALDTPIDRFIPPQMKMTALIERTRKLVETDWRPVAREQLLRIAAERRV
ncbi:hypothetical protein FRB98_008016 [Tulasnella sp. 332]|nr:hypothetical protein FRB98_008016 [Tulasnella sp. 332]